MTSSREGAPRLPWAITVVLLGTAIAYPLTSGSGRDTVSWTIVLLGSALTVVHAGLSRGWRTGLAVAALAVVVSVLFEAVGLATGFPYGSYTYSDALGPTLLGVPFLVPLAWLMMVWPSWLLARRLVPGHRVGRVAVAAYVFAGWDVVLDPQLVQAGYWTWAHPTPALPGIDTVPLTNLAGWLLAGLVLMTLLDCWWPTGPRRCPTTPRWWRWRGWCSAVRWPTPAGWACPARPCGGCWSARRCWSPSRPTGAAAPPPSGAVT